MINILLLHILLSMSWATSPATTTATAEEFISFYRVDLAEAKRIAQRQDKLIFIDTYAVWCKPCKELDKTFNDREVANYFNTHFVNVKVDMDGAIGKKLAKQYDVVWLPTLLILDQDGNVRNKIDRLVGKSELLQIAREAINTGAVYTGEQLNSTPFGYNGSGTKEVKKEAKLITEDNAPVIYVHDERASSGRPHIMYHEAYLHMQLMDGKQYDVARKYLSTQTDWGTEKNIKFIFDFMRQANSKEFEYMISHKDAFVDMFGSEQVNKTIEILVQKRLFNGFPRPDLNEAVKLYEYLNPSTANERAHAYYLKRLKDEERTVEFERIAKKYLTQINPYDHQIMYHYAQTIIKSSNAMNKLDEAKKWMEEAVIYAPDRPSYQLLLANVYYLKGDKTQALSYCDQANALASAQGLPTTEIDRLKSKISSL